MDVHVRPHVLAAFPRWKELTVPIDWLSPRTGLDVMEKRNISCLYRASNLIYSAVQHIAWSLYRLIYPGLRRKK
jgi:hypothetical protein